LQNRDYTQNVKAGWLLGGLASTGIRKLTSLPNQPPVDFHSPRPVNSSHQHFPFFEMSFGLHVFARGKDREAGAIPALPRNCKRENRSRSLGNSREGRCKNLDAPGQLLTANCRQTHPHSQSQETGVNRPL
jgi:hypothetical protein